MSEDDWLTTRFEEHRPQLRAVAFRMLGSRSEAEDAVQEAWLRLVRAEPGQIENLGAWLTTVVGRVALNMLRRRRTHREEPLDALLEPSAGDELAGDPEQEALLADSIGLALLVVLDALSPAERLAFVLHDMFAVPFDEIAAMLERSPEATRQLASRARRRVRGAAPRSDPDPRVQRRALNAFLTAAREGDFEALIAVLDPAVVLRADGGAGNLVEVTGAQAVASRALSYAQPGLVVGRALVEGSAAWVATRDGQPISVMALGVRNGRIVRMDILADPTRLRELELTHLDD